MSPGDREKPAPCASALCPRRLRPPPVPAGQTASTAGAQARSARGHRQPRRPAGRGSSRHRGAAPGWFQSSRAGPGSRSHSAGPWPPGRRPGRAKPAGAGGNASRATPALPAKWRGTGAPSAPARRAPGRTMPRKAGGGAGKDLVRAQGPAGSETEFLRETRFLGFDPPDFVPPRAPPYWMAA